MKTKVRVSRKALIRVVEGRLRKAENELKRQRIAYPKQVASFEAAVVKRLEQALTDAKRGRLPRDRYGHPRLDFGTPPVAPSEGRELCNLRRMLATLKMGTDDTLLLSQDDADEYFGPCRA